MKAKQGFSFLEIIIVLIIVGILVSIFIPNFIASLEQTKAQAARNNLYAISAAQQRYSEDNNGSYCVAGCGNTTANLNSNLRLSISTNDPFNYSCSAAGSLYSCIASDGTDKWTLSVNANGLGVSVICTVISGPGNNCPS